MKENIVGALIFGGIILLILFCVSTCSGNSSHSSKPTPTTAEQKAYEYTLDDKEKDLYDRLYGNPYDD